MVYQNFDQIEIPNQLEHPGACRIRTRSSISPAGSPWRPPTTCACRPASCGKYGADQWITTNFMAMHPDVDPTLSTKDLDVFTWTHYPVHGDRLSRRTDHWVSGSAAAPCRASCTISCGPSTASPGLMELQPGQVNWGAVNPWPQPGAIRMWILRAFGAGARMVCTYRYRQPLFGNEQYHKGLVETDGVTPSPGGREYAEAMRDVSPTARRSIARTRKEPAAYAKRRTAFLINFDNRWDIDIHKQTTRWDTVAHWMKYYRAPEEHDGAGGRGDRRSRSQQLSASWWRRPTSWWTRR